MAGLACNFSLGPRLVEDDPLGNCQRTSWQFVWLLGSHTSSWKDRIPPHHPESFFKQGSQPESRVSVLVTWGYPWVCSPNYCRKLSFLGLILSGKLFSQGLGASYEYNALFIPQHISSFKYFSYAHLTAWGLRLTGWEDLPKSQCSGQNGVESDVCVPPSLPSLLP